MGRPDLAPYALRVSSGWASTEADLASFHRRVAQGLCATPPAPRRAAGGLGVDHGRCSEDRGTGRRPRRRQVQARVRHRHRSGVRREGLNADTVRFISAKKDEPEWMLEMRLDAFERWQAMEGAHLGQGPLSEDRLPGPLLLRRPQAEGRPQEPRRRRSGASGHLRQARHPLEGAGGPGRRPGRAALCRGRGVRQRLGGDHLQEGAGPGGGDLLLDVGSRSRASGAGEAVPGLGGADFGQLFRLPERGGVLRRFVRLCAAGRALPDGAVDLFPHQRREHRPVRTDPDHRRQGRLRLLPGRLHRAPARREPAARRGGRAGGAGRRGDQIFHGAELVPRRRRGQGRHLQLRDQARGLPRRALQGVVDPGGDRLGHHLEVPVLHPARATTASASSTPLP